MFVAVAGALVAWLVATPARASAPLCDPRGATMIAPAPQLQAPTTSLEAAAPVDDASCSITAAAARAWSHGRAPTPSSAGATSVSAALPATTVRLAIDSPCSAASAPVDGSSAQRSGERSRVDRPPRG